MFVRIAAIEAKRARLAGAGGVASARIGRAIDGSGRTPRGARRTRAAPARRCDSDPRRRRARRRPRDSLDRAERARGAEPANVDPIDVALARRRAGDPEPALRDAALVVARRARRSAAVSMRSSRSHGRTASPDHPVHFALSRPSPARIAALGRALRTRRRARRVGARGRARADGRSRGLATAALFDAIRRSARPRRAAAAATLAGPATRRCGYG